MNKRSSPGAFANKLDGPLSPQAGRRSFWAD